MKFLLSVFVTVVFSTSCFAEQYATYLTWPTFPRPNTSIGNVIGENGEHMASWTFGYHEVFVWQPSNPNRQMWDITENAGTGYSTSGVHWINFESFALPLFLDSENFYVLITIEPGTANEWTGTRTQNYGSFLIVHFDSVDRSLGFESAQLFWAMERN